MYVSTIAPVTPAPAAPAPIVVFDHDGTPVPAPCMSRYCPPGHAHIPAMPFPPVPPVLVDHDGTQLPPKPGTGHGRA